MRIVFFCFILLLSLSFISQKRAPFGKITAPPGTVPLKEGLFIDYAEISNGNWRAYMDWISKDDADTSLYTKMYPDTMVWYSMKFDWKKYISSYYQSRIYDDYPVVGISYEQALAFCEWRSERVNDLLLRTKDAPFRNVVYRLPTEKEWEWAAAGKLDNSRFPFGYETTKLKIKGGDTIKMFNCYYTEFDSATSAIGAALPVSFSMPNQYGVYNIIGNVAEMVSEKGLAKGGHYDLPLEYCKVTEKLGYDKPNRYLGFRCVCQIDTSFSLKRQKELLKKEKAPSKKTKGKGPATIEQ